MDRYENLSELQQRLDYRFKRPSLLEQALTHRSYVPEAGKPAQDNERLEFLGDAVLELVISDLLFRRFGSKYHEGDLTKMRAYLVSETRLVGLARELCLGQYLLMGRGEEKCGGRSRPSILADAFEAVVGALYMDGGYESAYDFIKRRFEELIDSAPEKGLRMDYKSRLQEMTQRQYHRLPTYELVETTGPDHDRLFKVSLHFGDVTISQGTGKTKKEAEQQAAKAALKYFQEKSFGNGFG